MIFQIFMVLCILGVTLICDVIGASYSNVYMERDVVPKRYYQYGTPYPSVADPRLSQINTLPTIQGYVAPCVSPCVYPVQTAANVASVNPSPNVLTYNSPAPSVPIVVSPTKEEATPYEYSYFVYDENTGDNKAQRELSDGSVVRGEYSFLQPDGYVREVQYVADDISGFNAVVKNFLPVAVDGKRKVEEQEKESSPPCHEIKNESLKEGSEGDSDVTSTKQSELAEKSKESGGEKIHQKAPKESGKDKEVKLKDKQQMKAKHLKEESEEKFNENFSEESKERSKEEKLHKKPKETTKESKEESRHESVSEESKEELKEKSWKKFGEDSWEKNKKESKEKSDENSREESVVASPGKHKEAHELLKPTDEVLVSYKDIIKCIEAAMKRNYGVPAAMRQGPSPLTYIVLNKPC